MLSRKQYRVLSPEGAIVGIANSDEKPAYTMSFAWENASYNLPDADVNPEAGYTEQIVDQTSDEPGVWVDVPPA